MVLSAVDVVDLQLFLMDGVRRYVDASAVASVDSDDALASAAALDYALLLSSERANEPLDDSAPVAQSVRSTMARAARAALGLIAQIVRGPEDRFTDFVSRYGRVDGIFATLEALRRRGVIADDEVAFRALTLASDVLARRTR